MNKAKIALIGLGYVGLPLARLFATKYPVIGFDIDYNRIEHLKKGIDLSGEVTKNNLLPVLINSFIGAKKGLFCTNKTNDLKNCNYFIITVPTPVDKANKPDLTHLYQASETVGILLKPGDVVIYESTVYPGATEEECVPILEKCSGLKYNEQFFVGYSPERINPGDKLHSIEKVVKITAGSDPNTSHKVDQLYKSIIKAGTYNAPSIKIAEAAKVIENSQRDINIAFVNELAKIFNLMEIDTLEVLKAASTKWNFMPFKPGLVGGHCIGVDPYYLAQKAQSYGYHPEIILSGRRINDGMGAYVASQVIKLMLKKDLKVHGSKVLVLGFTFKENCSDVRNTKVIDVIKNLQSFGTEVTIFDPWALPMEVEKEYGIQSTTKLPKATYSAIVLAVAHKEFLEIDLKNLQDTKCVIYDVKSFLSQKVTGRL